MNYLAHFQHFFPYGNCLTRKRTPIISIGFEFLYFDIQWSWTGNGYHWRGCIYLFSGVRLQVPITKVIIIQDAAALRGCIMSVHGPLWRLLHEAQANCGKPITVSIRWYTYILSGSCEPRVLKLQQIATTFAISGEVIYLLYAILIRYNACGTRNK